MKSLGCRSVSTVAAFMMAASPWVLGADTDTKQDNSKNTQTQLEAQVKTLEERIQKLEEQLDQASHNRRSEISNDWREFQRRRFGRDFDDMLDQLQREFNLGMGFGGQTPNFNQIPFNTRMSDQRPRLGVEMAPATDEYRERFKNDCKDGSFVLEVVPGSPAEKAGLLTGDCITSFAGKPVKSPQELKDAVLEAPKGKNDIVVMRRGESLALKVEFAEPVADETNNTNILEQGGWLRRGDAIPGGNQQTRTEVKASALEMSDDLAKHLNLSAEQKQKMQDVLAKQNQLLAEDVAREQGGTVLGRGNTFSFNMNSDVNSKVEKRVAEAEKELKGTLTPEQIQKWEGYRRRHNSVSVSHSMIINGGKGNIDKDDKNTGF